MKGPKKRREIVRRRQWDERDIDASKRETAREHKAAKGGGRIGDIDALFTETSPNAVVVSPYGVLAFVEWEGGETLCKVADDLTDSRTSFLTAGDRVRVEMRGEDPTIVGAAPRQSKLGRLDHSRDREKVFAANVDQLIIVASVVKPDFKPGLVDRYLIAAQIGGVTPVLCINKVDLVDALPAETRLYDDMGIAIFQTSCKTGLGMAAMQEALRGKTSVLAGHSGVGKSSLVNAIAPGLAIATQTISDQTRKGRHTTTASRLYTLEGGIRLIDTPGIKSLGLWGVSEEEIAHYFPEFVGYAARCRFRNCTHTHEPDCAVREAVDSGAVSAARHASYCRIRASFEDDKGPQKDGRIGKR